MPLAMATALALAIAMGGAVPAIAAASVSPRDNQGDSRVPAPRVGECFDYGVKEMDQLSATVPAVPCRNWHTAEVFRVATWTSRESPYVMSNRALWRIANQKCSPQDDRAFANGDLNYWAYFLPTRSEWRSGQRWIRCDALRATSTNPLRLARWRGAIL